MHFNCIVLLHIQFDKFLKYFNISPKMLTIIATLIEMNLSNPFPKLLNRLGLPGNPKHHLIPKLPLQLQHPPGPFLPVPPVPLPLPVPPIPPIPPVPFIPFALAPSPAPVPCPCPLVP